MPTCETTARDELGVLREHRAHQQAAVAAALDRELRRASVAALDQVPQHGGEVVEHVLLLRQVAGLVPRLAVLAAAAQVGDRDDDAVVEQHAPGRIEAGLEADAVAAVAGDQAGIRPVERRPLGTRMLTGTLVPSLLVANSRTTVTSVEGRPPAARSAAASSVSPAPARSGTTLGRLDDRTRR